ncbi:MAG: hypothetical protein JWS08_09525 [Phormidium sp. PBR-2020]|nr:MAG: hypothetical protein JWS08_09525 [Phormidium sp. PBR-2020]
MGHNCGSDREGLLLDLFLGRVEKTPHWLEWGENNEGRIENGLGLS